MIYREMCTRADIEPHLVHTDSEAKDHIRACVASGRGLDVITTDLNHWEEGGLELIKWIRGLPDDYVCAGGLRMRHLPIVVISAVVDSYRAVLLEIDSTISIVEKGMASSKQIFVAIENAITQFRHRVMAELDRVGVAIAFEDGRYRVLEAYLPRTTGLMHSKYISGTANDLAFTVQRLVLGLDRLHFGEQGVDELEWLLNQPDIRERDLHQFFLRHPEFLLANSYSWYWSEPSLRSSVGERRIRPDFLLQPFDAAAPAGWAVVDLKSPNVPLITSSRFHADFSHHVHHVIAQLRDYGEYFANPANESVLRKRFGGTSPRPRLVAIIGRQPKKSLDQFAAASRRVPDVFISTYDDVLTFRKAQLAKLRAMLANE